MTNIKSTKRALTASVIATLLCFAMLIGTTFAWFTDTASTGVNRIQAGNLKMEVSCKDAVSGEFAPVSKDTPVFNNEALWEPGYVEYAVLNVKNVGSLALKYRLGINIVSETGSKSVNGNDFMLSDYIRFAVIGGEADASSRSKLIAEAGDGAPIKSGYSKESYLESTGDNETVTLVIWMPETVGNDANYAEGQAVPEIDLGINVYATQYTKESDSFDNTYDKFAAYATNNETRSVNNYNELQQALNAGANIDFNSFMESDDSKTGAADRLVIKYPTVLQLNAPYYVHGVLEETDNWAAFFINADTTINSTSGGGIACIDKVNPSEGQYKGGPYVAHISGDNIVVTVNGGTYYGGGTVFNVQKGTLVVNGGFFQVTPDVGTNDCRYTLNCIDANYKNGTANIVVKGGTFVNFDPSNNLAEGQGTNFVADGYKVVSEAQANGDIWYTVVAA